jgi:hypothetical protein
MAHGRYDLTEFEWNVINPLLPNKVRGVPRVDDRRVLNGIFFDCSNSVLSYCVHFVRVRGSFVNA